ncbi:hypothetical protein PUN28_016776 [Cardiocondyla obscurior]|uniref:Uncharacterized protein n=1 Tax=Cardiocondyla obscurior TaxID=286306 RepID=A0AAW2ENP5_9HYME
MPWHNGTEISIRWTNIISDYTAANGGRFTIVLPHMPPACALNRKAPVPVTAPHTHTLPRGAQKPGKCSRLEAVFTNTALPHNKHPTRKNIERRSAYIDLRYWRERSLIRGHLRFFQRFLRESKMSLSHSISDNY